MAYPDLPQIDSASEHDDEAKNKLTGAFSQKAGFVSREQIPDKGCDYLVELIENSSAKNWHFGIQLKSIQTPSVIFNGEIISYPFYTSRLGYMMRNAPIYGLLVIYDVSSKQLYYEYVEELYKKLMERENDGWKNKDQVNVHIPRTNLLNAEAILSIHETFLKRFTNLSRMSNDNAANYDLPVVKTSFVSEYNLNITGDVVDVLRRWGLSSIPVDDIPVIYALVNRLPNSEIIKHKELSILAALAFGEAGKVADSAYHVQKILKRFTLSPGENLMVRFIKLKNDYSLGLVNAAKFIIESRILLKETDDSQNKLTLRLNILNFELLLIKPFTNIPVALADEISELADLIDQLENKTSKFYLKLWNLENLALLIGLVRTQGLNEMTVLEEFGKPLTMDQRLYAAKQLVAMQELFTRELHSVDQHAKETENTLLQAFTILLHTRTKLSLEIDLITYAKDPLDLVEREKWLIHHINLCQHGFEVFMKSGLLGPAYTLLCLTSELNTIMIQWFGFTSALKAENLEANLQLLEHELEFAPFQSSVLNLISQKKKTDKIDEDTHHGMKGLLNMDSNQIQNFAEMTMRSGKFPNAKLDYMIHEMESFKMFYQRCTNPYIYPTVNQVPLNVVYSFKPSFQLKNLRTGVISLNSSNMDELLSAWGM